MDAFSFYDGRDIDPAALEILIKLSARAGDPGTGHMALAHRGLRIARQAESTLDRQMMERAVQDLTEALEGMAKDRVECISAGVGYWAIMHCTHHLQTLGREGEAVGLLERMMPKVRSVRRYSWISSCD